ncbi:MAG: hypothetical protein VW169_05100 [Rhodospirillaceae bacterium]
MSHIRAFGFALLAAAFLTATVSADPASAATAEREDGIHAQSWFRNISFLDPKEDLDEVSFPLITAPGLI